MLNKNVFLVIQHLDVGGADKRIIENWLFLREKGFTHVKLVINKILYSKLLKVSEFSGVLKKHQCAIVFLDWRGGTTVKLRRLIVQFMKENDGSVFHFILFQPFLFPGFFSGNSIIYTYPMTSLSQLNWKGMLSVFFSVLVSKKVDVLNPNVASFLKKIFFWKRRSITITPGSSVNTDYYTSVPFKDKKNWVVFLGRFENMKQIIKLMHEIPKVNFYLQEKGIVDCEFKIIGRGTLEYEVKRLASDFKNIPVEVYSTYDPVETLRYSKVFLSLQKYSNYPSKSLLEAISCGNLPVVTDVGETRLIAKEEFSSYIPESFSWEDLSGEVYSILALTEEEYSDKATVGISYVKSKFSLEISSSYFSTLYIGC